MRKYYQILGVSQNATTAEIRDAWVFSVKAFHPDKFTESSERQQALAQERTKAINEAYSALSDPSSRANYDKSLGRDVGTSTRPSESSPPQPQPQPQPQPRPQPRPQRPPTQRPAHSAHLRRGRAYVEDIPVGLRAKLLRRVTGQETDQYRAGIGGLAGSYAIIVIVTGILFTLSSSASQHIWTSDGRRNIDILIACCAIALPHAISVVVRWYRSPFRQFLLVTPLYFVEFNYNEVRYWPLWEVITLGAVDSQSSTRKLKLEFENESRCYRFWTQADFVGFMKAARSFLQRGWREGEDYFVKNDDFRSVECSTPNCRKRITGFRTTLSLYMVSFIGLALFGAFVNGVNKRAPVETTDKSVSLGSSSLHPITGTPVRDTSGAGGLQNVDLGNILTPATPTPFAEPELDKPLNGEKRNFAPDSEFGAPLEIKSSMGADYLVKLTSVDDPATQMTVYVIGGSVVTVNVPLGTYILKYASGTRWYGYEFLFGPYTIYSRAADTFTFDCPGFEDWKNRKAEAEEQIINLLRDNGLNDKLIQELRESDFASWHRWGQVRKAISRDEGLLNSFNSLNDKRNKVLREQPINTRGFTVTLYKVANGNLRTESISPREF